MMGQDVEMRSLTVTELAGLAAALAEELDRRADMSALAGGFAHGLAMRGALRDAAARVRDAHATLAQTLDRLRSLAPAAR